MVLHQRHPPTLYSSMSQRSPTLVVCTCISFNCKSESFLNQYGVYQPGRKIRSQLRSKHRTRDYELAVNTEVWCLFKLETHSDFIFISLDQFRAWLRSMRIVT